MPARLNSVGSVSSLCERYNHNWAHHNSLGAEGSGSKGKENVERLDKSDKASVKLLHQGGGGTGGVVHYGRGGTAIAAEATGGGSGSCRFDAPVEMKSLSVRDRSSTGGAEGPPGSDLDELSALESGGATTTTVAASPADQNWPTPREPEALRRPFRLAEWTVDHVASWLRSTPLAPEVVAQLRHHAVNGPVLESLTDDDLVAMGVEKFGWRRQLLLSRQELVRELDDRLRPPEGVDWHSIHSRAATPAASPTLGCRAVDAEGQSPDAAAAPESPSATVVLPQPLPPARTVTREHSFLPSPLATQRATASWSPYRQAPQRAVGAYTPGGSPVAVHATCHFPRGSSGLRSRPSPQYGSPLVAAVAAAATVAPPHGLAHRLAGGPQRGTERGGGRVLLRSTSPPSLRSADLPLVSAEAGAPSSGATPKLTSRSPPPPQTPGSQQWRQVRPHSPPQPQPAASTAPPAPSGASGSTSPSSTHRPLATALAPAMVGAGEQGPPPSPRPTAVPSGSSATMPAGPLPVGAAAASGGVGVVVGNPGPDRTAGRSGGATDRSSASPPAGRLCRAGSPGPCRSPRAAGPSAAHTTPRHPSRMAGRERLAQQHSSILCMSGTGSSSCSGTSGCTGSSAVPSTGSFVLQPAPATGGSTSIDREGSRGLSSSGSYGPAPNLGAAAAPIVTAVAVTASSSWQPPIDGPVISASAAEASVQPCHVELAPTSCRPRDGGGAPTDS